MFRRVIHRTTPFFRSPHARRYGTEPTSSTSRVHRINRRLPRFLHRYTSALANAPLSHITSFLILHELTAIIPLFGLAGYFHYTHWLPPWFAEGAWVLNGVERFGRYFRRKGWIRSGEAEEAEREVMEIQEQEGKWKQQDTTGEEDDDGKKLRKIDKAWKINEGGVRLVVEFATAYAITKALLVPRIMFSVWATPSFARWTVVPLTARLGKMFSRGKGQGSQASGAGTGAVRGRGCQETFLRFKNAQLSGYPTTRKMCFDDRDTYTTRTYVANGARVSESYTVPRHGMTWRRRHGLGGSYYPSRYYTRPPRGRYMSNALVQSNRYSGYSGYTGHAHRHSYPPSGSGYSGYNNYPQGVAGYTAHSSGYGRYYPGASVAMPRHTAMAYPKPRHQYIYTPRYGQRGYLSYAGQAPNGAPYTGVIPNGGMAYGYGGVGMGVAAGGYYPGVRSYQPLYPYLGASYATSYYPSYPYSSAYSGYYNYGLYGSLYPLANFYYPYQRSYYNTAPSYGYATQAYVYPPGPSATTTTTTYHVANSHAAPAGYSTRCEHRCATACEHVRTREDIQMESRRIATERGAYEPRRIRPADARDDDPFWCRERNGEWHLRTYYQIENECHPGRWMMDAELGYLVFHRA
ncbi:hypothetical protein FB567DRAFT_457636 [Paraphoma chrysanthemicola]|uniref:Uncharacterized protein n=1 Tax=Paraphoma chrysanthemicola TaxID=798071 RepID=A0A8K0QU00_9PLEO|nr:hypothetical protein FB567DRAFT_457636 [Paraphoma chrysanthemicola]